MERKKRGLTQKIFLIETKEITDEKMREYVVIGSSYNVYNIVIKNIPTCTCPDYMTRKKRCKHIYFVMLRIMKIIDCDKKQYGDEELINMFKNIPEITNLLCVNNEVKDMYLKSKKSEKSEKSEITIKTDDICPICLDDIQNGEDYEHCKSQCGKCVHVSCFKMWCVKNPSVCLMCRSPWNENNNNNNNNNNNMKYMKLVL